MLYLQLNLRLFLDWWCSTSWAPMIKSTHFLLWLFLAELNGPLVQDNLANTDFTTCYMPFIPTPDFSYTVFSPPVHRAHYYFLTSGWNILATSFQMKCPFPKDCQDLETCESVLLLWLMVKYYSKNLWKTMGTLANSIPCRWCWSVNGVHNIDWTWWPVSQGPDFSFKILTRSCLC